MQTDQSSVRPDWYSLHNGSRMQVAPEADLGSVAAAKVERLEELAEGRAATAGTAGALEAEAMVVA